MPKTKKDSSSSDSDSGPEDRNPPNKKSKVDQTEIAQSSSTTGADAEWKLDKMRFVSVSEFRGRQYVNIREYYEKDGKVLPGKKGIALSREQWKKLCGYADEINKELN